MKQIRGMLFETADGGIAVGMVPLGQMYMEVEVPTPWMSETERQAAYAVARDDAYSGGYIIEWERRVRNSLSDRKGERTTLVMRLRPCATEDEVAFVEAHLFRLTGLQRSEVQ